MTEPVVLINLFTMPPELVDNFVARWVDNAERMKNATGFRGTTLHRAIDSDSPFPLVNVAQWDSVEDWQAAVGGRFNRQASGPVTSQPALYTVVHVTG
ncbi:MAG TPA: antibiotic biosynthesis monooxygenase family protein [Pseudonocardiaceae bacterium]|jgi:heme-degrading monooxygenase HmoA